MTAKERSDKIEAVLNEVLSEHDDWEEGDMLIDWVLVAYATNPDSEKESMYPMFVSNGVMAGYRVRGLLLTALASYLIDDE